ncbi:6402_t:CDS:2, partial [Dentiscutata heterogama]
EYYNKKVPECLEDNRQKGVDIDACSISVKLRVGPGKGYPELVATRVGGAEYLATPMAHQIGYQLARQHRYGAEITFEG